jgi:hypothetical protein
MEKTSEEKEMQLFSWPTFFFVTGVSSFCFSFLLKILNGNHSLLFLSIGAAALLAGILNLFANNKGPGTTVKPHQ